MEGSGGPQQAREQKLGDWLYGQIFDRIVSGAYALQARLPSEAALATEFSVSRPIVREALARLRDDEVVESRRGSGSYVRRRPSATLRRFAPVSSVADLQRCFEFRIAVEAATARLAAERHDAAQLEAIELALARLDDALATGALGNEADFEFHRAVAAASGNRYFTEMLDLMRPHIDVGMQVSRNLSLHRPRERLRRVQEEHRAIVAAIRARDAAAAGRAMAEHIGNARRRMFEGDPGAEPVG